MSGSAIDSQQYECRLPNQLASLCICGLRPNIRIPVLRSGDDAVRYRSPIDRGDQFVVLRLTVSSKKRGGEYQTVPQTASLLGSSPSPFSCKVERRYCLG